MKNMIDNKLIINARHHHDLKFKIRDSFILLLTWSCWLYLLLHPFIHTWLYREENNLQSFLGLSLYQLIVRLILTFIGAIVLFHSWSIFNRLVWSIKNRNS